MSTGEGQAQLSIRKEAWRGLRKHFDEISTVAVVTVALRAAAFLPMLLCVDFGGKLPMWMGWIAAAAVYIAGAVPMRFWGREKMRRMFYSRHLNHRKKDVYKKWLSAGLLRYVRGILWGLPFLAGLVYFTVFRARLNAKAFWMPVRSLAVLAGREPDTAVGFLVAMGLMALFGLLFAYGWWRDLPMEYLPVRSLGAVKALHWSRRILKKHRKEMRKNALVNCCLSLPAVIGVGAVLATYARSKVDLSLGGETAVNQALRLLRTLPPNRVLLMLGAAVVFLYVPFWIFRKTRNAALMGRLMRENAHSSSSSSHSSGRRSENALPQTPPKKVDFHPSIVGAPKAEPRPAETPDAEMKPRETEQESHEA